MRQSYGRQLKLFIKIVADFFSLSCCLPVSVVRYRENGAVKSEAGDASLESLTRDGHLDKPRSASHNIDFAVDAINGSILCSDLCDASAGVFPDFGQPGL